MIGYRVNAQLYLRRRQMKYFLLACGCLLSLAVFAMTGCKPKPRYQMVGEPSLDQPPATPRPTSPAQSPTPSPHRASYCGRERAFLSRRMANSLLTGARQRAARMPSPKWEMGQFATLP